MAGAGHGVAIIPLPEMTERIGRMIETSKTRGLPDLQFWMSIAEHLKDATRWQKFRRHDLPYAVPHGALIITPEQFDLWVDGI
jgi:hypothetical protein